MFRGPDKLVSSDLEDAHSTPNVGTLRGKPEDGEDGRTDAKPTESHPLHSDGVVCRCAVHWRRESIARGLAGSEKGRGT